MNHTGSSWGTLHSRPGSPPRTRHRNRRSWTRSTPNMITMTTTTTPTAISATNKGNDSTTNQLHRDDDTQENRKPRRITSDAGHHHDDDNHHAPQEAPRAPANGKRYKGISPGQSPVTGAHRKPHKHSRPRHSPRKQDRPQSGIGCTSPLCCMSIEYTHKK